MLTVSTHSVLTIDRSRAGGYYGVYGKAKQRFSSFIPRREPVGQR